ncbi:hypothetical protein [Thiopseudomonas alkaliphila]|uniref:hypothetical protein n=1 Tax=Thiopseudomonas alkaliphila TaxID=1697053 RepID=UPI0011DD9FE7|nr:hypothetical protein [Thiopseudomonas alkaliphila]
MLEIIFPSFHRYINPYVMTDAAQIVLENNASGNVFRFLGWNGFLFSDYSVALAFTALGVLVFNVKTTIFSLFIEFSSIMLALIAGRSGLPIVFVYFLIAVFIKPSFFRLMLIFLLLSLGTVLILRLKGIDFFIWLFEPIYRLIEEGSFSSNSVAETGGQFSDFLSSVSFQDDGVFFGNGIYFSSNDSYFEFNFVSGDSAIIRLYHSIGIFGTAFFLMIWLSMLIKLFFSTVLNHTSYKIYAVFFVFYGIVFFLKSEWLYQKFYIFILFFLYHSIYSRYEKNYRRVSEE